MNYSHKQLGWVTIWAILPAVVLLSIAYAAAPNHPQFLAGAIIVLVPLSLFYCLTITVDHTSLKSAFGIGLIKKTILISDIDIVYQVRNKWWHGWGIHYIGGRWLYNVSGLDAIELRLKDGKIIRLGTDEPEALIRVIKTNMGMR